MRLPVLSGNLGSQEDPVDYELSSKMISYAIRHGINFFDSGYFYHNGDSERFYGYALSKHPRESFHFVTKAPPWNITTLADAKRIFQEQLDKCKMSYFDCYELHSLVREEDYERTFIKTGAIEYYKEEKAKGRIKHLGFSFHGRPEFLQRILDEGWAEVVTILVNGIDWKGVNFSEQLYGMIEKKGLPVVVMEPLCGGHLAHLKPAAHNFLKAAAPGKTDASWSLRFAAHPKNVMTVLSGMTFMEHLQDNLKTYCPLKPLTEEEQHFLEEIGTEMANYNTVPCTGCKYCMPCPYGINIPAIFTHYNKCLTEGNAPQENTSPTYARERRAFLIGYDRSVPKLRQADHCIGCGQCSPHCPQRIDIPKELQRISDYVDRLKRQG